MNDLIWGCLAGYIIGFFITFGVKTHKFKINRGWEDETCRGKRVDYRGTIKE